MLPIRLIATSIVMLTVVADISPVFAVFPPSEKQIDKWEKLLPESPQGVGPTIKNRAVWDEWAKSQQGQAIIKRAEKLLAQPMDDFSGELYLEFSRNGNRTRFQNANGIRKNRFIILVLAECMENRGRFIPAIEETAGKLCGDPTWVLPAHDRGGKNITSEVIDIDLASAGFSWQIATTRYWLGDKLSPEIRKLIADELERRTFAPFAEAMKSVKPRMWWIYCTNNWNAVCLSGVTGSALATIDSRERRAFFAAAAEKQIEYYLKGFTPDGYCSEGLGYWNYGFSHFTMLAETLSRASGGKVNLFQRPKVRLIARFPRRIEILPGVYPAFADCNCFAKPNSTLTALLDHRYGWPSDATKYLKERTPNNLFDAVMKYCIMNMPPAENSVATPKDIFRDWFPDAGVLVCRPAPNSTHALGAAMKGGHNAEQHNHNDVGSFVVALGKSTPLVDPGNEVYTRRTFSDQRYDSKVLNSFGHPVPRVAGQLQRTGRKYAAKVLKTDFTPDTDTFILDLAPAYKVKQLKKLERKFVYSRREGTKLTVTDQVEFDGPQSFETALITFDEWTQVAPNRLRVGKSPDAVMVEIDASEAAFRVVPVKIEEHLPRNRIPTRLGIELIEPVERATITLVITPVK